MVPSTNLVQGFTLRSFYSVVEGVSPGRFVSVKVIVTVCCGEEGKSLSKRVA